jgi:DNA modification methylase
LDEKDRQYHEVANIFPLMSAEEYEALKVDIATNGLLEPVWLHPDDHSIIDGRNRHKACVDLGKAPKFRYWDKQGSLVSFVVSLNLKRRHLNESQRAMVAAKIANMQQGARTDVQPSANLQKVRQSEAAKILNVSERSVASAKSIRDHGTPELIKAVESGKVAVSTAAKIAQAPPKEQVVIVAQGPKQIVKAAKEIQEEKKADKQKSIEQKAKAISEAPPIPVEAIPANVAVINADSRTIAKLGIEPVHLVITSPPYNVGIDYNEHDDSLSQDEYLDLIEEVFRSCYDVMADGARIAVNVPFGVGRNPWVPFAARITDILSSSGFILRGQIIWDKGNSGNRTSWGSFRLSSDPSLRDTSEAIIVAHKGSSKLYIPESVKQVDAKGTHTPALASSDYFMELAQDHWIVAPESARRVGHPAPFPVALAKRLIDLYAYPGAHILDPFAGSGSTGIAALEAGCSVTLVEVDPTYCRLIEERLSSD